MGQISWWCIEELGRARDGGSEHGARGREQVRVHEAVRPREAAIFNPCAIADSIRSPKAARRLARLQAAATEEKASRTVLAMSAG